MMLKKFRVFLNKNNVTLTVLIWVLISVISDLYQGKIVAIDKAIIHGLVALFFTWGYSNTNKKDCRKANT